MGDLTGSNRLVATFRRRLRDAREDDRGSVVETVIIAAGLAALALSVMAAITILVDAKVAGISL
jgi:hypothetical protein